MIPCFFFVCVWIFRRAKWTCVIGDASVVPPPPSQMYEARTVRQHQQQHHCRRHTHTHTLTSHIRNTAEIYSADECSKKKQIIQRFFILINISIKYLFFFSFLLCCCPFAGPDNIEVQNFYKKILLIAIINGGHMYDHAIFVLLSFSAQIVLTTHVTMNRECESKWEEMKMIFIDCFPLKLKRTLHRTCSPLPLLSVSRRFLKWITKYHSFLTHLREIHWQHKIKTESYHNMENNNTPPLRL